MPLPNIEPRLWIPAYLWNENAYTCNGAHALFVDRAAR